MMNGVDSEWNAYEDATFVKGRHFTELDHQAQKYIIDVARPGQSIERILEKLNNDYKVKKSNEKEKELGLVELDFKKEVSECVLPYIT